LRVLKSANTAQAEVFSCAELSAPPNALAPHELQRGFGNKPSSQVRYHSGWQAAKALWNNGFGTAKKKVLTLLALSVSYRHESTLLPGLRRTADG
jgi:hypothetical protein